MNIVKERLLELKKDGDAQKAGLFLEKDLDFNMLLILLCAFGEIESKGKAKDKTENGSEMEGADGNQNHSKETLFDVISKLTPVGLLKSAQHWANIANELYQFQPPSTTFPMGDPMPPRIAKQLRRIGRLLV